MSHPFTLSQGVSPIEQLSAPVAPSSLVPEHSPRPKRWHLSPDPVDDMPLGGTTSKATSEGLPSSKQWEIPPWYKVLTWSHSEVFSWDTSLVRETRKEYFKRHSPNFTMEGMHDLSEVFRCMAKTAELLGSAIYEIQEVWKGPDELQQANYALRSLPKGLEFLQVVPHQSPQRLWDWWAYTTQTPFATSMAWPSAPGVGRRARMRGQSSTTFGWCTTGSAWCVTNVIHWPHQTPSTGQQNCQPSGQGGPNKPASSE